MPFEKIPSGFTHTLECATGLKQYTVLTVSTAARWVQASSAGGRVVGVLLESSTGSTENRFRTAGTFGPVFKMRVSTASTAIAPGNFVGVSTAGTVTPTSAADYTIGVALENVGTTGTVIPVCAIPWGTT